MTLGFITFRHILAHPLVLIGTFGFLSYLHMIALSLDRKPHGFVEYLKF